MSCKRKQFDGYLPTDEVAIKAAYILTAALDDERKLNGKVILSDTLCCFIENRIAQALDEAGL